MNAKKIFVSEKMISQVMDDECLMVKITTYKNIHTKRSHHATFVHRSWEVNVTIFFHDFMTFVFRILILIYSMESPWLSIIAFLSPYLLSWIPPTRKSPIDILYNIDYSSSKYGWIVKWFLKVDKSKLYRRFQFQWQQEKKVRFFESLVSISFKMTISVKCPSWNIRK